MTEKMKGLVDKKEQAFIYLDIKYGGLCQVSKTEVEGFEPITVENPETKQKITKFVKYYDEVEGMVVSIEWRDTKKEYKQRFMDWKIAINANGTPVMLTIPFKARIGSRFMNVAENIDYSKPLAIRAWKDGEGMAIMFLQGGKNIKSKYTREDRGEMPDPTFDDLDGWDFSAVNKFLYEQMIDVVIPAVEGCGNKMPEETVSQGLSAQGTRPNTFVEEHHDDTEPADLDEMDSEIPF